MSAVLYDVALLNKLKGWIKDPNLTITGPDETQRLFSSIADKNNDKPIQLPLIALRRKSTMEILNTSRRPLTHDGWKTSTPIGGNYYYKQTSPERVSDEELLGGKVTQLNAIPIRLSYRIDIYTRKFEEAEEYVRDFIFRLINFPEVQIIVPYNNCNMPQAAFIQLASDVEDNSDIPERLIAGQFTRKSISFTIDGYLYSYRTKDAAEIDVNNMSVECSCKNKK